MSYGTVLLKGLAVHIDANDLGVWHESGVYAATDRGIRISDFPSAPDNMITLTRYQTRYDAGAMSATRIQIRYRIKGHPFGGEQLYDDLHDLLHRKAHVDFGAVRIGRVMEVSFAPMATDANGRFLYTHNFEFTGMRWQNPIITPSGD